MAFQLIESPDSGETTIQPPSYTLTFSATGEADQNVVISNVIAGTPGTAFTSIGTLYRQDIRVSPQGGSFFKVAVPYGPSKHETGSYTFSFDTTGGTAKVKCSKQHISTSYPSGGSGGSNPHKGMINVTPDMKADGADIIIPALKLNVTFRHPSGVVTIPYAKTLAACTGCWNTDTFLTFDPGELLFSGANGSDGSEAEAEVTYQFIASQNVTNLVVGPITVPAKQGHDYAWVESNDATDTGGPACQPQRVHVERVYDGVAFASNFGWS